MMYVKKSFDVHHILFSKRLTKPLKQPLKSYHQLHYEFILFRLFCQ